MRDFLIIVHKYLFAIRELEPFKTSCKYQWNIAILSKSVAYANLSAPDKKTGLDAIALFLAQNLERYLAL